MNLNSSLRKENSTRNLKRWIVFGGFAVIIPVLFAIINFAINKNFVEKKEKQTYDSMLRNIQYSIDTRLNEIENIAKYYLLNQDFSLYALDVDDELKFLNQIDKCHAIMKVIRNANPDIEALIYVNQKDYLLTSSTANTLTNIYKSIDNSKPNVLGINKWREIFQNTNNRGYTLQSYIGYNNFGRECIVYTTPLMHSNSDSSDYLYLSLPSSFLENLMNQDSSLKQSLLIINDNQIIGQYGAPISLSSFEYPANNEDVFYFSMNDEKYLGISTKSQKNNWTYVICTPENILLKELHRNSNLSLLMIVFGAVLGLVVMILLQHKNYRPIRELLDILPNPELKKDKSFDEFSYLNKSLRSLYENNQALIEILDSRKENDKKLALLSTLNGRTDFYPDLNFPLIKDFNEDDSSFFLVTILLDLIDSSSVFSDKTLFAFSLENVISESFSDRYNYLCTTDTNYLVYVFVVESSNALKSMIEIENKFSTIYDFFENQLSTELTITFSSIFEKTNDISSRYAELIEVSEMREYMDPIGLMHINELRSEYTSLGPKLLYFTGKFISVFQTKNKDFADKLIKELFAEINQIKNPFTNNLYFVLAITNTIIMYSQHKLLANSIDESELDLILSRLRNSKSIGMLQLEFTNFIDQICNDVNTENEQLENYSEKVVAYVDQNYKNPDLNITLIADKLNISAKYLARIFKEQTGFVLLNYITKLRIDESILLLQNTNYTIDEIAEKSGFTNSRTFRRNFKKITNLTPQDFRSSRQKGK